MKAKDPDFLTYYIQTQAVRQLIANNVNRSPYCEFGKPDFVHICKFQHQIEQIREGTVEHHSSYRRVFCSIKKATVHLIKGYTSKN